MAKNDDFKVYNQYLFPEQQLGRVIDHILSAYLSSLLFTDRMINKELVCLIKQFGLVCCTNQGILLRSLIGRGVCCATP